MATATVNLVSVNAGGAMVSVDDVEKFIGWTNLKDCAKHAPTDVRHIYAALLRDAEDKFRTLPRSAQGIEVVVSSRTSGATWVAEVYDGAGNYRRDLMRADEGMDDPHLSLAKKGGQEMAARIGCTMRVVGV